MAGCSFATQSQVPAEVRLLPFYRNWHRAVISLLFTFQSNGSQVLEKDISESKKNNKRPI